MRFHKFDPFDWWNQYFGDDGENVIFGRRKADHLRGGDGRDAIFADRGDDIVRGGGGDDQLFGGFGNDRLLGEGGADVVRGGKGADQIFGGTQGDLLYGEQGNDRLYGDAGPTAARGDFGADVLNGGSGRDRLFQSQGVDTLTGGADADMLVFKFKDPMTALAAGTGPGFSNITDFNAADDTIAFDAAGFGTDAAGANFIENASGGPGSSVDSFFSGAAAGANGESVVVVTDQAFASGALAIQAVDGEQAGDFVIYFNTTVNAGSLLHVNAPDQAVSIARFTDVLSLADLQAKGFSADDFIFV